MSDKPIVIDHFSDVLCVWAYAAQIRVDELQREFGKQVQMKYHFMPLFAVTEKRIGEGWRERGGYAGFGQHVQEICQQFPHIKVSADVWQGDIPKSSANAHLFLKAVQILEQSGEISTEPRTEFNGHSLFEESTWRLRLKFFQDNQNIARLECQQELMSEMGLPEARIMELLHDGSAAAALCRDDELCKEFGVSGSPTYVLNEGRQKLYGNVGYKLIAANVQEVLHQPVAQASWC
jgi:predicted DsbA family dithiol-disulfide isomerase